MKLNHEIQLPKLHNRFVVEVKDSKTGEIINRAEAENVVLNQFYAFIMYNLVHGDRLKFLAYGNGSGTPAAADTNLFNYLGYLANTQRTLTTISENLVQLDLKFEMNESTFIGGTITEVGLRQDTGALSGNKLITHAMLKDSEGNPITLGPKTNTEKWEIYATMYVERGVGMSAFPNTFSDYCTMDSAYLVAWLKGKYYPQNLDMPYPQGDATPTVKTRTTAVQRIAAGTGNADKNSLYATTDILGFKYDSFDNGVWFPNHAIFPPFTFSERTIGTGDGSNKYFNLDSGFFIDSSLVVKVGGVVKTKDVDYKVNQGARQILNYLNYQYPYDSKIEALVYSTDANKANQVLLGTASAGVNITDSTLVYRLLDFQKLTEIPDIRISATGSCTMNVYYSDDGINWNGPIPVVYTATGQKLWTELRGITARYLWIASSNTRYLGRMWDMYGQPSIEFITPPALSAVITAAWQTEIPPKNANFFYDVQTSFAFDW